MEIKLAKSAGFCFGVKRAVDMVYEQAQKREERLDAGGRAGAGYLYIWSGHSQ